MKIFIVGGGFAGIAAARQLSKISNKETEVYLIDKNAYASMLPNLPEIVSGRLKKEVVTEKLLNLIPNSVRFIHDNIEEINFNGKSIITKNSVYQYDYLVLSAGSKTNYFGFDQNVEKINVLESLESAEKLKRDFNKYIVNKQEGTLLISGAGFTGIELACNLYELCKKQNKRLQVVFVEVSKKVLPMLSEKSSAHVIKKLGELRFTILKENQIKSFDGINITLKNGEEFKDVFFCWCSGVKASLRPFGDYEALSDGRIIVNEFLSIPDYPEVFAAGDAAAIKNAKGMYLRRAVTFAQMSGKHAGKNLCAEILGKRKKPFKSIDLGWIIPLYISSVGVALGVEVRGRKGIFMHYFLCGIKNYNFKNFLKELNAALKYLFVKP